MDPINQQPTQPPVQPVVPPPAPITPQPAIQQTVVTPTPEHKSWGAIISIIIILILLIAAAVYAWGQKLNNEANRAPAEQAPVSQTSETNQTATVAEPVDELTNLETELNTSVEGLDESNF